MLRVDGLQKEKHMCGLYEDYTEKLAYTYIHIWVVVKIIVPFCLPQILGAVL